MRTCLPFIWAGYRAEARYTYRLEDLHSENALWEGLAGNIRREIRKAQRQLRVRQGDDVDLFHGVDEDLPSARIWRPPIVTS